MYIFQGSHIKIKTNTEMPVQVDGEPWLQPAGDIVVLRSALKVKNKNFFAMKIIHFGLFFRIIFPRNFVSCAATDLLHLYI